MLGLFEEGGDFRLNGFVDQIVWFFHSCRGRGLVNFQEALRVIGSTFWAEFTVKLTSRGRGSGQCVWAWIGRKVNLRMLWTVS